ncbi:FadR/GntR family transcriptional regulator [Rhizohabitans arisaemae]|uniref:FadR/GntR family transcriptional regulator n=1 Tax=Rhizohabitans arisaemae TaxID=2720610 RepID=UPI0024B0AE83|nr:FCD domain-containing protein [Rhizohabitans arisaemae]
MAQPEQIERTGSFAAFRPVRSGNTFEETVERLLQAIKLGMPGFGDKLPPERELAAQLKISRVTLREAIRALQEAGYVQVRRGRYGGAFVTYQPSSPRREELERLVADITAEELDDTLTFRMAVECGAAQALASAALSPAQRAILEERLHDVNTATPEDYRRLDTAFHMSIAELTGSSLLVDACADARLRVTDLLYAIPVLDRNIEHSAAQHAAIVAAIVSGDPVSAWRAMAEHLQGTAALLRGFLT